MLSCHPRNMGSQIIPSAAAGAAGGSSSKINFKSHFMNYCETNSFVSPNSQILGIYCTDLVMAF